MSFELVCSHVFPNKWQADPGVWCLAMPINYAFYCSEEHLRPELMEMLGDDPKPHVGVTERGLTYAYRWPDLEILVSQMPQERVASHVRGLEGYIRKYHRPGRDADLNSLVENARNTRYVVGLEVSSYEDESNRGSAALGFLATHLKPSMIFAQNSILDGQGKVLLEDPFDQQQG